MRLYYEQFGEGTSNFGDILNVWLWEQLIPNLLDEDDETVFIGIGTLLNDELQAKTPQAKRRIIFSSGVGYGQSPLTLRPEDIVYCVRGPLSADRLGLDESAAVTDGALLIRGLFASGGAKRFKFSFMPHIARIADEAWASICEELGFGYIDPRGTVDEVLHQIDETEVLIAEAMHGAIVADILRVPWIPVTTSMEILSFKWQDWCASVGLEYHPHRISTLFNLRRKERDPLAMLRQIRYKVRRDMSLKELRELSRTAVPVLSEASLLESLTSELEARLDRLRADQGILSTK